MYYYVFFSPPNLNFVTFLRFYTFTGSRSTTTLLLTHKYSHIINPPRCFLIDTQPRALIAIKTTFFAITGTLTGLPVGQMSFKPNVQRTAFVFKFNINGHGQRVGKVWIQTCIERPTANGTWLAGFFGR